MAGTIPQPRSYQSILGDMIDAFLSRYGLRGLKTGGPLLSILEAAAQSDVRSTQDIFNLLDANDIDRATGLALDRKAGDEDLVRFSVSPSSGPVTISDTSFTKVQSKVYPGTAAPNAGTSALRVSDASAFPATGAVYIGRGTTNYEGPINYGSITPSGNYYIINLSTPTQKFHDVNETVILSKGGDRVVPAGTTVRTSQGNVAESVTFTTLDAATILDGETSVEGVDVVCTQPGVIGNVPKSAIKEFTSAPFVGAAVNNASPFDNGQPAEDDTALRERIKAARQSRSRGTPLALITNAKGIQAPDENKTVVSASVFRTQGEPTILFIDDGSGYEEVNEGVAAETLLDLALGGEQYFQLSGATPVTKAFSTTKLTAPFTLLAGSKISVKVAGVLTEHSFSASEFRSIANATAYEVVGAINGDPNLLFSARTAENGTRVSLFARSELNEDLEVVTPDVGINANTYLGFPTGINYTLRLYKNDQLLYKDGRKATILTTPQTAWSNTIASGIYIKVKVDGTPAAVYKITSQNFIDAGTGYTAVSASNSLEAWAAVFNARIPGITCSVSSGRLQFVSNRAATNASALTISAPGSADKDTDGVTVVDATNNLLQKGMFTAAVGLSATGRANDYTLNRATGELKLASPLASGDFLTAGTEFTRAYLQGSEIASTTISLASTANLFVVVDGATAIVATGVTSGTTFDITSSGSRRIYTTNPASSIFANLQVGDWVIIWDPAFTTRGAWRVAAVSATAFEVEREVAHAAQTGIAPSSGGMVFVRTAAEVQQIAVASGVNRALTSIASEINTTLLGGTASVFRNKYLRLTTDTFGTNGDIFLAAADVEGKKLLLPAARLVTNNSSHLAAVESSTGESGTPAFATGSVSALPGGTLGAIITFTGGNFPSGGDAVGFLRRLPTDGYGNNAGLYSGVKSISGADVTLRTVMPRTIIGDRVVALSPFAIGPEDNLTVILDNLATTKNYNIPLYRSIKPVAGQSYTATNLQVTDSDNSNNPLSTAFGIIDADFFRDFAVYMKARGKSHSATNGVPSATYHHNKAILWRYARMGPEGELVRLSYVNPTGPSLPISIDTVTSTFAEIRITLPSDVARTGLSLNDATRFTVAVVPGAPADTITYSYSKPTVSLQRVSNVVTGTTGTAHGYSPGDVVYITSGDVAFPSGPKTLVTASGTTFTYNESAADAGPSAGHSVSSAPADPNFGAVVVGDIVNIGAGTAFAAAHKGSFRVTAKTATSFTIKRVTGSVVAVTNPTSIGLAGNLTFYPIKTADSTAAKIVTWITANASALVSAVAVENGGGAPGTGTIDRSTEDEYLEGYGNTPSGTPDTAWALYDGVNWVMSSNLGAAPNTVTLKRSVTSDLVSNSDFDNETMKLVPINAEALVRYLSSPAVSGLYAGSSVVASSRNNKLQLSSTTAGAAGSVQVTGGSANSVGALVRGAGSVVGSVYSKVTVASSALKGLVGNQWVAVQGSAVQPKAVPITAASSLVSIVATSGNWLVTFDGGTTLWNRRQTITDASDSWMIDRVGRFVSFTLVDGGAANTLTGSIQEGDWVKVQLKNANPANNGTFRVVRKESSTRFWVENTSGVSEYVAVSAAAPADSVDFFSYDSVMVGDTLTIDTGIFGAKNRGSFLVAATTTGAANTCLVTGDMEAFAAGGALGVNSGFVRFVEAAPIRLIKQIRTIGRTPGVTDFYDVMFNTSAMATKMSAAAGASIQPLDKLGFSSDLVSGADSYTSAVGLIGEVNKVMYGDSNNPSVYPGVVAAGAQVNVSGPLVKRITVGLAVRVRTAATASDVVDRVKSAVASAVNRVAIGQSVAISSIVSAAQGVDGVVAVTVLSPTYTSGSDLIPVQANEKPRILDIDQDIQVSVVGV